MLRKILLLNFYLTLILNCPDQDQRCNSCFGNQCRLCENSLVDLAGICQVPETEIDYCLRYKTRHACYECQYGYQTDEFGQCQSIQIDECLELKNSKECLICDKKKLAQNGKCETDKTCSIKNCQYCYTDSVRKIERCQRCQKEYVIYIQNEVEVCVPETKDLLHCHYADIEDQKKCRICDLNYYYLNGRCLQSEINYIHKFKFVIFTIVLLIIQFFYIMIKDSISNFLILSLGDEKLVNITNFEPKIHLAKWLRIINPIHFSKERVKNLDWVKSIDIIDTFVIQYGVKETLHLDQDSLRIQDEESIFSACIAFNDVHFKQIIKKMAHEQKECLLAHLKQFTDEFKEQIEYYFEQQKQSQKSKNEILKILVETEKKLAEEEEKNKLLKASLEDRQKIKNVYEQQLNNKKKQIEELLELKDYNQEQFDQQSVDIKKQNIQIQEMQKLLNKSKTENRTLEDKQSKIISDMSDMKDKIDIYESQIKENRKKIIENNDLHFQLSQNEQKMSHYKELQDISHNQKYQVSILESKNHDNQKLIQNLKDQLQKKDKTIEFFKQLQKDFEQKSSQSLSKIIALQKDNKRFKAFNKSLMQKTYLQDKKKFNIQDQDTKIFRQSWIQDEKVQGALAQNYRNELQKRDEEINRLQKIVDQSQQKVQQINQISTLLNLKYPINQQIENRFIIYFMGKQASIKDQLKDYFLNPDKKRTSITVEVIRGKNAMISDSNRYYFASKNLEKLLKKDGVKQKQLYLKIKKWSFVESKKNQIELQIDSYNVLKKKGNDLNQKNKNVLDYQEIRNLMDQQVSKGKRTPGKKSAKQTPMKSLKFKKQTPLKKKIKKKSSESEKVEKSLKSKKQTPLKRQNKKNIQKPKLALVGLSSSNKYNAAELIFAQVYDLNKKPASVSVPRKLTGAKEFKNLNKNYEEKLRMNREEKLNYDKELQKTRQTSNIKATYEKIPKSLRNTPMTYAEILHGIQKGMISWEEINVNYQEKLARVKKLSLQLHNAALFNQKQIADYHDISSFIDGALKSTYIENLCLGQLFNMLLELHLDEFANIFKIIFQSQKINLKNSLQNLDSIIQKSESWQMKFQVLKKKQQEIKNKENFDDKNRLSQNQNFIQFQTAMTNKEQQTALEIFNQEKKLNKEVNDIMDDIEIGIFDKLDTVTNPVILIRVNEKISQNVLKLQKDSEQNVDKLLNHLNKTNQDSSNFEQIQQNLQKILDNFSEITNPLDLLMLSSSHQLKKEEKQKFEDLKNFIDKNFTSGYLKIFKKILQIFQKLKNLGTDSKLTQTTVINQNFDEQFEDHQLQIKGLKEEITQLNVQNLDLQDEYFETEATNEQLRKQLRKLKKENKELKDFLISSDQFGNVSSQFLQNNENNLEEETNQDDKNLSMSKAIRLKKKMKILKERLKQKKKDNQQNDYEDLTDEQDYEGSSDKQRKRIRSKKRSKNRSSKRDNQQDNSSKRSKKKSTKRKKIDDNGNEYEEESESYTSEEYDQFNDQARQRKSRIKNILNKRAQLLKGNEEHDNNRRNSSFINKVTSDLKLQKNNSQEVSRYKQKKNKKQRLDKPGQQYRSHKKSIFKKGTKNYEEYISNDSQEYSQDEQEGVIKRQKKKDKRKKLRKIKKRRKIIKEGSQIQSGDESSEYEEVTEYETDSQQYSSNSDTGSSKEQRKKQKNRKRKKVYKKKIKNNEDDQDSEYYTSYESSQYSDEYSDLTSEKNSKKIKKQQYKKRNRSSQTYSYYSSYSSDQNDNESLSNDQRIKKKSKNRRHKKQRERHSRNNKRSQSDHSSYYYDSSSSFTYEQDDNDGKHKKIRRKKRDENQLQKNKNQKNYKKKDGKKRQYKRHQLSNGEIIYSQESLTSKSQNKVINKETNEKYKKQRKKKKKRESQKNRNKENSDDDSSRDQYSKKSNEKQNKKYRSVRKSKRYNDDSEEYIQDYDADQIKQNSRIEKITKTQKKKQIQKLTFEEQTQTFYNFQCNKCNSFQHTGESYSQLMQMAKQDNMRILNQIRFKKTERQENQSGCYQSFEQMPQIEQLDRGYRFSTCFEQQQNNQNKQTILQQQQKGLQKQESITNQLGYQQNILQPKNLQQQFKRSSFSQMQQQNQQINQEYTQRQSIPQQEQIGIDNQDFNYQNHNYQQNVNIQQDNLQGYQNMTNYDQFQNQQNLQNYDPYQQQLQNYEQRLTQVLSPQTVDNNYNIFDQRQSLQINNHYKQQFDLLGQKQKSNENHQSYSIMQQLIRYSNLIINLLSKVSQSDKQMIVKKLLNVIDPSMTQSFFQFQNFQKKQGKKFINKKKFLQKKSKSIFHQTKQDQNQPKKFYDNLIKISHLNFSSFSHKPKKNKNKKQKVYMDLKKPQKIEREKEPIERRIHEAIYSYSVERQNKSMLFKSSEKKKIRKYNPSKLKLQIFMKLEKSINLHSEKLDDNNLIKTKSIELIDEFSQVHNHCYPKCNHKERFINIMKAFLQSSVQRELLKLPKIILNDNNVFNQFINQQILNEIYLNKLFDNYKIKLLFKEIINILLPKLNLQEQFTNLQQMIDYSKVEKKVFDLINEVRQNPQLLVDDLKAMIKNFNKRYYKVPNTNVNIITNEGATAVEEAIEFLQKQETIEPLIHSEGLYLAAQDHCQDIGKRGVASHESEDGSRMCDRVEKYGEWMISIAENICFDDSDPKEIVMGQLVDDGNQSRGHRLNIFNPEFKFVGVACGPHKVFKNCSVFNFAVSFKDENKKEGNAFQKEQTEQDNVYRRRTTIPEDNTIVNKRGSFGQPNFNANQDVTVEGGQDDNMDDGVLKEDMEMPEGAVDCKVKRIIKRVGNKKITKTIRTYTMENGEKEVEEEIDEEFVKNQQQILQI